MMKWLLFIILVVGSAFAKAQTPLDELLPVIEEKDRRINDTLNRNYDDRELEVTYLEKDLRSVYTGNEFTYLLIEDESENFLSGFFNGIFDFIERVFGVTVSPFWSAFMKYAVYVLIAVFAIYFLLRLLGNETASAVIGKSSKNRSQVSIQDTHIEEIDLDSMIREQMAGGNYRGAIRFMYLNSLKKLSAAGTIDWDYQKTNADYLREIKDSQIKEQFKDISYLYDHIWYGEFILDEKKFNEAAKVFQPLSPVL
jgi:hypothetical protein